MSNGFSAVEFANAFRAPEGELAPAIQKMPLAQAGFVPQLVELAVGQPGANPALGLSVNGLPQRNERPDEIASRVLTMDEASGNFDRFALMVSGSIKRGGRYISENTIEGIRNIARGAGLPVDYPDNPEGNTIDGAYFLNLYRMAAFGSDNSPAAFIKAVEQATSEVDDFKMSEEMVADILERYPFACVTLDYLTNPQVVHELQNGTPHPVTGRVVPDPRQEYIITLETPIRAGTPITVRGGPPIPAVPLNRRVLIEEEAALGYAIYESLGFRDYLNHKPVRFAEGRYSIDVNSNQENSGHFWRGVVADPFSSIRRPYEFVEYVKQRFGVEIARGLGLEQLDFGWRTYGQQILTRATARGVSASQEIMDEVNHYGAGRGTDRFLYQPGTTVNGAPVPAGTPILDRGGRPVSKYLPGTAVNGIVLSEADIKPSTIRFWKKMKKASDAMGKLFEGLSDPKKGMEATVFAVGEYAREAFQEDLSRKQREAIIPQFLHFFQRLAASKGIPISDGEVNRLFQGLSVDLNMYKGLGGWFKKKGEKMHADYQQGKGNAIASRLEPQKGQSDKDQLVAFAKLFWGAK